MRDRAELKAKSGELMTEPHLYQKYISTSFGRDVRVLVIGKRVFGAILRKSEKDFRSNVALGGTAEEYPLPESVKRTCERIAEVLGLDYCGIDLLFGEKGFLVCEVNSNAFFSGFERVTRKNVAGAYAEFIINTVTREDR